MKTLLLFWSDVNLLLCGCDVELWMSTDSLLDGFAGASSPSAQAAMTKTAFLPVSAPSNPGSSGHVRLCPLGDAAVRWYLCTRHERSVLFVAGSGRVDAVANSCPLCGNYGSIFRGCACSHADNLLDRSERPARRLKRPAPG